MICHKCASKASVYQHSHADFGRLTKRSYRCQQGHTFMTYETLPEFCQLTTEQLDNRGKHKRVRPLTPEQKAAIAATARANGLKGGRPRIGFSEMTPDSVLERACEALAEDTLAQAMR